MAKVIIKKYKSQKVEHFDPNEKSLGFLNVLENTDLRCQIAEQALEGYYLIFKDEKIMINKEGELSRWPHNMYDQMGILISRLFKARRKQTLNNEKSED